MHVNIVYLHAYTLVVITPHSTFITCHVRVLVDATNATSDECNLRCRNRVYLGPHDSPKVSRNKKGEIAINDFKNLYNL